MEVEVTVPRLLPRPLESSVTVTSSTTPTWTFPVLSVNPSDLVRPQQWAREIRSGRVSVTGMEDVHFVHVSMEDEGRSPHFTGGRFQCVSYPVVVLMSGLVD